MIPNDELDAAEIIADLEKGLPAEIADQLDDLTPPERVILQLFYIRELQVDMGAIIKRVLSLPWIDEGANVRLERDEWTRLAREMRVYAQKYKRGTDEEIDNGA